MLENNEDIYIVGSIIATNEDIHITDKEGFKFEIIKIHEIKDNISLMIYAYVENMSDDYYIVIGEDHFTLD